MVRAASWRAVGMPPARATGAKRGLVQSRRGSRLVSRCRVLLLGLVVPVVPAAAQVVVGRTAAATDSASIITVDAFGDFSVPPSTASLVFQVQVEVDLGNDPTAGAASQADAILRALVRSDVPDSTIVPWGYGVGRVPDQFRGRPIPGGVPDTPARLESRAGFRINHLSVDRLHEVASLLVSEGVEDLEVIFEPEDMGAARDRALRLAVARARRDAETIAEAAGGELGTLRSITSSPDYRYQHAESRFFAVGLSGSMMGGGFQLVPSDVAVRVQIRAIWVFEPG